MPSELLGIPVEGKKPEDPPVGRLKGYLPVPLMEYGGTSELAAELRGAEALVRVPVGTEVLASALVGARLEESVTGGVTGHEGLFAQSFFSRSSLSTSA